MGVVTSFTLEEWIELAEDQPSGKGIPSDKRRYN